MLNSSFESLVAVLVCPAMLYSTMEVSHFDRYAKVAETVGKPNVGYFTLNS